jgi:phosphoribosylformylglycinamidine synthase subunit PurL
VGMVGKLPDPARAPVSGFGDEGHTIALVGPFEPSLAGSELEKLRGGLASELPAVDLAAQAEALAAVRDAVRSGAVASAHDVSEGGLACALAECCIQGGIGALVEIDARDEALFGEGPGGVIVSGPREHLESLPGARVIGETAGQALDIAGLLSVPVERLSGAYEGAIPAAFA